MEKWILEADETEIPDNIKKELIEKIKKYRHLQNLSRKLIDLIQKRNPTENEIAHIKNLMKRIKNLGPLQEEIFDNLRAFKNFYNEKIRWFESEINTQRKKFSRHLAQKLENLKNIQKTQKTVKKNWEENLKENLYKNTILSLNEKSKINKILQKSGLTEGDKKELITILCKLPTEDLISLLGEDFENHTKNYIKWGWDFDIGVKQLMLDKFLKKMKSSENVGVSNRNNTTKKLHLNQKKFIKIEKNDLRKIYKKLKEIGFKSVKEIENKLGASFRNPLYYGSVMREVDFLKLKEILGEINIKSMFQGADILHKIIIGRTEQIKLKKSEDIAELITIMLGDGNLGLDGIYVSIALNDIDDAAYVNYVKKLLKKNFKEVYIAEKRVKESKGYVLIINSKAVHQALISKGLVPGDKVLNQVDIPSWIFNKFNTVVRGLKGLFDTDGSITVNKKNRSLVLSFSNASKPLVEGFKKLCNKLGIQTGGVNGPYITKDIRYNSDSKMYMVSIEAKKQVKKLLEIVKPEKFKETFRYYWLGLNLLILGTPIQVKKKFKESIENYKIENNIKMFQYTKKNGIFLKNICVHILKDFYPEIDSNKIKTLVDNEIRKALKKNPYGGIHLKSQEDIILRIPSKIRNYVCSLIYDILTKNKGINREKTLSILTKEIFKSDNQPLIYALKTLRYKIALDKYFNSLIILIKKMKISLKNKEKISPTKLNSDLNLPFGRKTIERILNSLKNNFPEDFKIIS